MGRAYAYYRKRYENKGLYEEIWIKKENSWEHIPWRIIWMQISGECTFEQVSYEQLSNYYQRLLRMRRGINETTCISDSLR
jgi:hypothetical protein